MKNTTPASRAPGVSSVGMICAATASTSAASTALRNDSLASPGSWEAACASWEACAISGHPTGRAAAPRAATMNWSSDRRERSSASMGESLSSGSTDRIERAAVDGPSPPISEHCDFEEVSGLVRDVAGDPCQHAREPIRGYLEV